jgi:hypothetical protein
MQMLTHEKVQELIALEKNEAEEAYQLTLDIWLGVLVRLWTAFQKQPTPDQLDLYQEQLEEIPLALLEKAVKRAIRDYRYGNVPSVHDVWEALRKEMDLSTHDDIGDAIRQWSELRYEKIVYRFPYTPVKVDASMVQLAEGVA